MEWPSWPWGQVCTLFQRSLIMSILLPELEERWWHLLCPTTTRIMPVYKQNVLLEAPCPIAAGVLDTGLPPLVELIVMCRLKIMFGAGGKVENFIIIGLHLKNSVKWEDQDECLLSSTSSKSRVVYSSADIQNSTAPMKSEGGVCTLHREGKYSRTMLRALSKSTGWVISTNHFSWENADSLKQAFCENKRAIFPHFSNSKYCSSFKWKKKPRKALLESWVFFSLVSGCNFIMMKNKRKSKQMV